MRAFRADHERLLEHCLLGLAASQATSRSAGVAPRPRPSACSLRASPGPGGFPPGPPSGLLQVPPPTDGSGGWQRGVT
eukprot:9474454-Pyramimonas_sp.AAC.1